MSRHQLHWHDDDQPGLHSNTRQAAKPSQRLVSSCARHLWVLGVVCPGQAAPLQGEQSRQSCPRGHSCHHPCTVPLAATAPGYETGPVMCCMSSTRQVCVSSIDNCQPALVRRRSTVHKQPLVAWRTACHKNEEPWPYQLFCTIPKPQIANVTHDGDPQVRL